MRLDSTTESQFEMDKKNDGLHWITTAVFLVGEMMGAAMIALPIAMSNAGLIPGTILILLATLFNGFTGIQLGSNWTLMQKRWNEYKLHCRKPYPEMATRAMGKRAGVFVSVSLTVTMFGITTVLILLASKNFSMFLATFFQLHINFCYVILIVGIFIWPFIMLGTPVDFWQAAVGAALTSSIAAILIVLGTSRDASVCFPVAEYSQFSWTNLFLAYGTIVFSYGGHGAFPTLQHDMKQPKHFNRSVYASFAFIVIVYLIVSITGYSVYGNSLHETIIPSMQTGWISQTVNIMITIHLLPTIIIVFSPLSLQCEEWANAPNRFGWKRVAVRTAILIASIFTAESIPHFGVFLDLVGGSTITLMSMILPSVFYLFLFASNSKRELMIKNKEISADSPDDQIASIRDILEFTPKALLIFNIISLVFGIVGGVAASSSAILQLLDSHMAPPCYVQWWRGFSTIGDVGGPAH